MDILIVTQDFAPEKGGIQTYVIELAKSFLANGHTVRVICPGRKDEVNPLPGLAELVRISVHSSWLFLPLLTYLPRYLKRHPTVTRVLYAQWQGALAELFMSTSKKQHRSYALVHGRELLTSVLGPLAHFLMPKVFARMDAAFPNSAEVMRLTRALARPACPLHLAHPGVDPEQFHPMDANFLRQRYGLESKKILLCITRMVARKNLKRLIEVMPLVLSEVPDVVLLLGGNGPEREALQTQTRDLGLQNQVRFLGRILDEELVAHFNLADVFTLPSFSSPKDIEGFGIVFLEAGACEVAAVGSLSGGIPDAVEDGVTGLLVPPEDLIKLKNALLSLLKNPTWAQTMGKNARIRIEKGFSWSHAGKRLLAFMT